MDKCPPNARWPFHHQPGCKECSEWESKHSQAIDDYLVNLEIQQAARRAEQAARRKITRAGGNASEQQT